MVSFHSTWQGVKLSIKADWLISWGRGRGSGLSQSWMRLRNWEILPRFWWREDLIAFFFISNQLEQCGFIPNLLSTKTPALWKISFSVHFKPDLVTFLFLNDFRSFVSNWNCTSLVHVLHVFNWPVCLFFSCKNTNKHSMTQTVCLTSIEE